MTQQNQDLEQIQISNTVEAIVDELLVPQSSRDNSVQSNESDDLVLDTKVRPHLEYEPLEPREKDIKKFIELITPSQNQNHYICWLQNDDSTLWKKIQLKGIESPKLSLNQQSQQFPMAHINISQKFDQFQKKQSKIQTPIMHGQNLPLKQSQSQKKSQIDITWEDKTLDVPQSFDFQVKFKSSHRPKGNIFRDQFQRFNTNRIFGHESLVSEDFDQKKIKMPKKRKPITHQDFHKYSQKGCEKLKKDMTKQKFHPNSKPSHKKGRKDLTPKIKRTPIVYKNHIKFDKPDQINPQSPL